MRSYLPVPERTTVCGPFGALSVMVSVAVRTPFAVGLNVTLTVQLNEGTTPRPQLLTSAKSTAFVPVIRMLLILSDELPVLVSVTACGALLVPTIWAGKVRLSTESRTVGTGSAWRMRSLPTSAMSRLPQLPMARPKLPSEALVAGPPPLLGPMAKGLLAFPDFTTVLALLAGRVQAGDVMLACEPRSKRTM
jgi:hypothetical protein